MGTGGRVDEANTYDDAEPLAAADDYEAEIDMALNGQAICEGYDCRSPREGPFLLDLSDRDYPVMFCWHCFAAERLRIDPDEIGRIAV